MHSVVVRPDTASIRGMVNSIRHLVKVEELDGAAASDES
jgi:ribosomal protein L30